MKKKKIIYFIIALILICGCGAGAAYRIYGNGPKDITEMFFDPESREYIKNMTIYNDEKIELDDYTVTLESSVYDSEVGIGYLVFVIQQNDGKTDNLNKFFEKYSLIDYAGGSGREESVIDGNKMYFYKGLSLNIENHKYNKTKANRKRKMNNRMENANEIKKGFDSSISINIINWTDSLRK